MLQQYGLEIALACAVVAILYGIVSARWVLAQLPRDTALAFLCHHGVSSRGAAERFAAHGFRQVFNIEGGIDAWAREVDPGLPRY